MGDKPKKRAPRPASVKKKLAAPPDEGISLEEVDLDLESEIEMIDQGDDPYEYEPEVQHPWLALDPAEAVSEKPFEVTPQRILEAMLFVGASQPAARPAPAGNTESGASEKGTLENGHGGTGTSGKTAGKVKADATSDTGFLDAQRVAKLMRGVRADEIPDFVNDLNAEYERDSCPYRIVSGTAGFRMQFHHTDFKHIQSRFYGQIKEAELPQPVVDVLSLVAYRQPVTKEEINELRGRQAGSVLSQLVRRGLLQVERTDDKPRKMLYRTTPRFLELFGLNAIEDLPNSGQSEFSD